ncbi:hypothetical protein [Klebsiella pneumoniae]|uniref:hypothetical protein n=1 Tax=Klebsiella pneumoniae TaxID=573 RepID=UPI001FAD5F9C|nr:hypothetical protein [Klebsiella pneumoniae]MCI8196640.1 hypothetical protein [Klebsiella pneumoniae]HDY6876569.1 hypothetical protein [Klebsiella pneumoniae]HDZ1355737.1 hypothetical protein [Klebsiella pneumoniae]
MTDITELAQREKFEAWFKSSFHPDKTGPYIKDQLYFAWKAAGTELVEALEKAQQVDEELCKLLPPGAEYMDPPDGGDVTPLEGVRRMVADYRQRIAELESRTVTVKLPKPHAHLIWIQAGHAPDDYWDDVAVSHSEKDRCCDGSERYPVYARWEIEEMLAAAGIKVEDE